MDINEYLFTEIYPRIDESLDNYLLRIGVNNDDLQTTKDSLLRGESVLKDIKIKANNNTPLNILHMKKYEQDEIDFATRLRHRHGNISYKDMITELDPEFYDDAEQYSKALNVKPAFAKAAFDGNITNVYNKDLLRENIDNPNEVGLANIFASIEDPNEKSWLKSVASIITSDDVPEKSFLLSAQHELFLSPENSEKWNYALNRAKRIIATEDEKKEEVEEAIEIINDELPNIAAIKAFDFTNVDEAQLTEKERKLIKEYPPAREEGQRFVGKAMATFPEEIDISKTFAQTLEYLGLTDKKNIYYTRKKIEIGRWLAEAQRNAGGNDMVLVLKPTEYIHRKNNDIYFSDFQIDFVFRKEFEAAIKNKLAVPNPKFVRFEMYGGLWTSEEKYRDYRDSISDVPIYITPALKEKILFYKKLEEDEDKLGYVKPAIEDPQLLKSYKGFEKTGIHVFEWMAGVLGVPIRFMAGMAAKEFKDADPGIWSTIKAGFDNSITHFSDPEKHKYFTTIFSDPDILFSMDVMNKEDFQKYKMLERQLISATDAKSRKEATNEFNEFREKIFDSEKAGYIGLGLMFDIFLDPLTYFTIGTGKSVESASKQLEDLVARNVRKMGLDAGETTIKLADEMRKKSRLEPISKKARESYNALKKKMKEERGEIGPPKKPELKVAKPGEEIKITKRIEREPEEPTVELLEVTDAEREYIDAPRKEILKEGDIEIPEVVEERQVGGVLSFAKKKREKEKIAMLERRRQKIEELEAEYEKRQIDVAMARSEDAELRIASTPVEELNILRDIHQKYFHEKFSSLSAEELEIVKRLLEFTEVKGSRVSSIRMPSVYFWVRKNLRPIAEVGAEEYNNAFRVYNEIYNDFNSLSRIEKQGLIDIWAHYKNREIPSTLIPPTGLKPIPGEKGEIRIPIPSAITPEGMAATKVGKQAGKEVAEEFVVKTSPKAEAEIALQQRKKVSEGIIGKGEGLKPRVEKKTVAQLKIEEQFRKRETKSALLSYGFTEEEADKFALIAKPSPATEPGRFRIAMDLVASKIDEYGKRLGLEKAVINERKKAAIQTLINNEKRFGKKGLVATIPIVGKTLYANSLEKPIYDGVKNILLKASKNKYVNSFMEFPIDVGRVVSGILSPTPMSSKRLLRAAEELKREVVEASSIYPLSEYSRSLNLLEKDFSAKEIEDAKRLALDYILGDLYKEQYIDSSLRKRLNIKASKKVENAAFMLKSYVFGLSPELRFADKSKTLYQIAEQSADLDTVFVSSVLRTAEKDARTLLQEEFDLGIFATRLTGRPLSIEDAKKELNRFFQATELKGSGFARNIVDKSKLPQDTLKVHDDIVSFFSESKIPSKAAQVGTQEAKAIIGKIKLSETSVDLTKRMLSRKLLNEIFSGDAPPKIDSLEEYIRSNPENLAHLTKILNKYPDKVKEISSLYDKIREVRKEDWPILAEWWRQSNTNDAINTGMWANKDSLVVATRKYLDSDINYQMRRIFPVLSGKTDYDILTNGVRELTNRWKWIATVTNPGFHIRNAYSGAFVYWLGGGTDLASDYGKATRIFQIDLSKPLPKWVNEIVPGTNLTYAETKALAEKHGVVDSSFTISDLPSDIQSLIEKSEKAFKGSVKLKRKIDIPRKLGRFVEGQGRLALFVNELKAGNAADYAAEHVHRFFFDYSALSKSTRWAKNHVPFLIFMQKNFALQLEQLVKQPGKFNNLIKIGRFFDEYAKQEYGDDYRRYVPSWVRGMAAIATPEFLSPDNDPFLVSFGVPAKTLYSIADLANVLAEEGVDKFGEKLISESAGVFNPIYGQLALLTGITDSIYDSFRGKYLRKDVLTELRGDNWRYLYDHKDNDKIKEIMQTFGIVEKEEKLYAPETSAYLAQMMPPLMGIWKVIDGWGEWNKTDKNKIEEYFRGASYLFGVKGLTTDKLKGQLSFIYDLQKMYNDAQEADNDFFMNKYPEGKEEGYSLQKLRFLRKKR